MKLALLSALLLGAQAASHSDQGQATGSEAPEPLATQPGIPSATSAAAGTAPPPPAGNVTKLLLRGVETLDERVLAYGGGDPVSMFEAAKGLVLLVQDLTRVLNGTKPSLPAAAAAASPSSASGGSASPPVTRASFAASGAGGDPGAAMRPAIERLLRDINDTKWAFQLASICDIMYFAVGQVGESFHDLLTTVVAQAPAADQAAANKTVAGATHAFEQSQALLGPRYCINANGQGPFRPGHQNSSAPHWNPQLPPPPPPPAGFRAFGSNSTMTSSSSARLSTATSVANPAATNDRAQGAAAAETTLSGDAPAATAGAAGGLRVPAAAAWGFLLAVPGFLL